MRSSSWFVVWGAALLLWSGCTTTTTLRPKPDNTPRSIPAEVREEFQRSITGWNLGSLDQFVGIYADDATFALKDSFLVGLPAIRNYYASQFVPGVQRGTLTFDELNVQILAPDLVLTLGIYRNTQSSGEVTRGTTSLVMRYVVGRWRIIHDHSS